MRSIANGPTLARRTGAILLALGVVAGTGLVTGSSPAVAGMTWQKVPSANHGTGGANVLLSTSCVSSTFCMAVGSWHPKYKSPTTVALAERWNGATWSTVTVPPSKTTASQLDSVSCTSPTFCVAVGAAGIDTASSIYGVPLVETWNGTSWSTPVEATALPLPAGFHNGSLNSVSCFSQTDCMAVGEWTFVPFALVVPQALAIAYDGTNWTGQTLPSQGSGQVLHGVSCVTNGNCVAVGTWRGTPGGALIEYEKQGSWQVTATAAPLAVTPNGNDHLTAVSCVTSQTGGYVNAGVSCMAVGGGPSGPYAELGDPGANTWVAVLPTYATSTTVFTAVSCVAGKGCDATVNSGQALEASIAEWRGGTDWFKESLAGLTVNRTANALYGVSCLATALCTTVGSSGIIDTPTTLVATGPAPVGGYWLVASDGGIFTYGPGAHFWGSTGGMTLNKPIVAMAAVPPVTGGTVQSGYWMVGADGGIFTYGSAQFYGSTGGLTLNKAIVGMATTADGKGYWLVAADGGIFSFGDAVFYGSTGGLTLNKPIVGMATTPDGKGYWLVAADGGIFAFGDAVFYGSTGGMTLNDPIVGMAANPTGDGYWLVASDGGIFAYGPQAHFYGSTGGMQLVAPVVGMVASPDGAGYWLAAADGGLFNYGDAPFYGSNGGTVLNKPVVGMAYT